MRTLQAVYFSIKRIIDFLIFFSFVVFVYAGFGYKIFQDLEEPYHTHPFYDEYVNNYSSYSVIANSLMVLVTFDNYPLVMRPFICSNRSPAISPYYLLYFMPYILVNILFFIPIPIAVVYDGFRVVTAETGKKKQAHARR